MDPQTDTFRFTSVAMDRAILDRPVRMAPSRVALWRRVRDEQSFNCKAPSAACVWLYCAWIGLICGMAEGLLRLGWRLSGFHVGDPDLWVNWQTPWMAPLAQAAIFFAFGIAASVLRLLLPRITTAATPIVLIALGVWSALVTVPGLQLWSILVLALGMGLRLGRRARFDSPAALRFARASLPAAGLIWLALFATTGIIPWASETWHLTRAAKPPRTAPNVLLVVLDTVRADNLSLYGYGRDTSPNLMAWSRRGVRFDQARATTPYTLGTHASLFTGHWMSETSARVATPLDGSKRTLAEHLRDRGYATGGFVGNIFYGSAYYGLNRGFVHYHDSPGNITRRATPRELFRSTAMGNAVLNWAERKAHIMAPMQRMRLDGEEVNREALAWVDHTQEHDRPFFLFVNYFDAHSPYSLPGHAPQPYSRLTADRLEQRMKHLERVEAENDAHPAPPEDTKLDALRAEVNAHLRDSYDDGIAWVDRKLDELLRGLESRGLLENTLVIVTADHGEMLGEHGVIGHGMSLHREVVHVPLVILGAAGMNVPVGLAVDLPVSLRDVPATVLDLLHDSNAHPFPGRSLTRFWTGEPPTPANESPVLSEMEHLSWRPHTARTPAAHGRLRLLTEDHWSYHRTDLSKDQIHEALFNLTVDPDETRDLANDPAHRATLIRLRERLSRCLDNSPENAFKQLSMTTCDGSH